MDTQTVSAESNPELATQLINSAMTQVAREPEPMTPAPLPPDTTVELLGGALDILTGMVSKDAEIRELNGADEEALSRIQSVGKMLMAVLQRGTISVGGEPAKADVLDDLLSGDRELLILAIRKATFGAEVELRGECPLCGAADQVFDVNLNTDVKYKTLDDPVSDRFFTVKCRVGEVSVQLPTGHVQKKLITAAEKTPAELDTILLKECIQSINGIPVMDISQILKMGIADRRKITAELNKRNPGPMLQETKKTCGACGQEVPLPLTLADLFRV